MVDAAITQTEAVWRLAKHNFHTIRAARVLTALLNNNQRNVVTDGERRQGVCKSGTHRTHNELGVGLGVVMKVRVSDCPCCDFHRGCHTDDITQIALKRHVMPC